MMRYLLPWLLLWSVWAGAEPFFPANPALTDKSAYLSHDGIVRYDLESLKPRWTALMGQWTDAPVLVGDILLVGSSRGLYALATEDGRVHWHRPARDRVFSPVVSAGVAYAGGEDGRLRAVTVAQGSLRWQRPFPGWVYSPAVMDGKLVVGGQPHRLYGLEGVDGALLWERPLTQELVHHPVALDPNTAVITTFAGEVTAVTAATGRARWNIRDTVANLSPVVAGPRLLFRTFGGGLKARRSADGSRLWTLELPGPVAAPVGMAGSNLWVYDGGAGALRRLDASTGRTLGRMALPGAPVASPVVIGDGLLVFMKGRPGGPPQPVVVPVPFTP